MVDTPLQQAEALCAGMTSRWRADRVRALELLLKAGGGPLEREFFSWLPGNAWEPCFNHWLFEKVGQKGRNSQLSRVSLSRMARKQLGWPVESGLADVRALVARAKNVYPVSGKEPVQ